MERSSEERPRTDTRELGIAALCTGERNTAARIAERIAERGIAARIAALCTEVRGTAARRIEALVPGICTQEIPGTDTRNTVLPNTQGIGMRGTDTLELDTLASGTAESGTPDRTADTTDCCTDSPRALDRRYCRIDRVSCSPSIQI